MDFQGFQTSMPLWLIAILVILSVSLAWYSYHRYKNLSLILKMCLTGLRATVFLLLILLLLNPFFQTTDTKLLNPDFLVFADNTASTAIKKGNYQGVETYQQVLKELNLQNRNGINYESFLFGNQVRPAPLDSLRLNEGETNLYNFTEIVKQKQLSTKGVILISDGIYTFGRNPVFAVQDLSIPVFTIAVGDTQSVQDIVISSIDTAPTGYVNTKHTIKATIQNSGFENSMAEVRLIDGETVLEQKSIRLEKSGTQKTISFQVNFKTDGLKQFQVQVQKLAGEWSTENNSRLISIDVIDTKIRVLHAAYEIHPDVKILRDILSRVKNIELIPRTWIRENHFIEGNLPVNTDSLDLLIIHGFPDETPAQLVLSSLGQDLPTVFIHTPLSMINSFPASLSILTLLEDSRLTPQRVTFTFGMPKDAHPVLELPETTLSDLPPVMASFRGSSLKPLSQSLFNVLYQGIETDQSIIAVTTAGTARRAQINGHGWYRIYQSGSEPQRAFIRSLFENIINWTSENPDRRRLKITPKKNVFNTGEKVELNGFLTNESGEEEPGAIINVNISTPDNLTRTFTMQNEGQGNYSLSINSGTYGTYSYIATAKKGARTIDSVDGEYVVDKSSDELVNTIRNDRLLKSIAAQTGGSFYTYSNADELWSDLNDLGLLEQEKISENKFHFVIHSPLWFIIIILLLTAEWGIRKYFALT